MFIDGAITAKYHNVTVSKGMPLTITCLSKCRSDSSCKVIWTTNKTVFVRNDEEHTVWSTPPYKNTQAHHLSIYSAGKSSKYQCLLIDITGRIIDLAEQQVHVEELGE